MSKQKSKKPVVAHPAPEHLVSGLLPPIPAWLQELGAFVPLQVLGGPHMEKSPFSARYYQTGLTTPGATRLGADLVKVQAITVDVDLKLHPVVLERLGGGDVEVAKTALYAMSQEQVFALAEEVGFYRDALENLGGIAGLPSPNRAVFTGHGVALQFWLDEHTGIGPRAPNFETSPWNAADLTALSTDLPELPGLWAWDSEAKSAGTRLSPIPGERHRSCGHYGHTPNGKTAHELHALPGTSWRRHDGFLLTHEVLAKISARLAPFRSAAASSRRKRAPSSAAPKAPRSGRVVSEPEYKLWNAAWDEDYGFAGPASHHLCPDCGRDTLSRRGNQYRCWHADHNVVYVIVDTRSGDDDGWPDFVTTVEVDFNGPHAVWPSVERFPDQAILAPRTGAGKTHILNQLKDDFLEGNDPLAPANAQRRVIMICPTKRLAEATSVRLGLPYSTPTNKINWTKGSFVTCFAGFEGLTKSITIRELRNTMFIVDEIEQCLKQLDGMIESKKGVHLLQQLNYCVAYSCAVYLADAHAGSRTQLLLQQCADARAAYLTTARGQGLDLGPFRFIRYWSPPHRFDIKLLPERVLGVDASESPAFKLVGQVKRELEAGQHVALICWKQGDVDAIAQEISEEMPDIKVGKVRGGETDDVREELTPEFLTKDLLIYNTAMNSGVSIDIPNHYNVRALLLDGCEADGPSFEQMAHRVRSPASPSIIVAADGWRPVSGWRTSPEGHDRLATKQWEAEVAAHGRSSSSFGGDLYLQEMSTARYVDMVMVSRAESYREGKGWLAAWLQNHHDVEVCDYDPDIFYSRVRGRIKENRDDLSAAIALAPLMALDTFSKAETRSRRTAEEEASYQATRHASFYGRTAWAGFSEQDRIALAQNRHCMDEARLWMAVRFMEVGRTDVLAWWSKKVNHWRTRADAQQIMAKAEIAAPIIKAFVEARTMTVEQMTLVWMKHRGNAHLFSDFGFKAHTEAERVQHTMACAGVTIRKARGKDSYKISAKSLDFMARTTMVKQRSLIKEYESEKKKDEAKASTTY